MATNNCVNLKSSGIVSYDGSGAFSALANPLIVSNGGQGNSSLTAYAVICGGTSSTSAFQSIASVGTANQVLTSNGAGALPTFQTTTGDTPTVYTLSNNSGNPADGATYFLANGSTTIAITASGNAQSRFYATMTCNITIVYGQVRVTGTLGTTENSTLSIRKNNTTDTTVTSTLQLNSATVDFSNTGLSIALAAGDYFELKLATPTWSTNPTTVSFDIGVIAT